MSRSNGWQSSLRQLRQRADERRLGQADLVGVVAERSRLLQLQRIASWWDGHSAKLNALLEIIERYEPPYLIWTHWRETGDAVANGLARYEYKAGLVTGETTDRDATIEAPVFSDNEKAVLRYTDDVVRNVKASDKTLKAVQSFLTPGAVVELTLTIGYYMMVCRLLETTGVEGEEGQAEWLKTAKL